MAPAHALPTGTLTLLFTDIEGSTRLVQTLGAARYAELQADHRRLLRAAFAAHGGHEVTTQGDSFFAVFTHATAAVAAAIDAQRALASHPWPEEGAVRVRMGLHAGEPVRAGEGYVGVALNRGARVCAVARGGQIYLSLACRNILASSDHPHDWEFRDLGEHRLKDIRHTEHLFQVLAPGMPDVATPPATAKDLHPRDRILVSEAAVNRPAPEVARLLLDAVRAGGTYGTGDTDGAVALSPADLQAVAAAPATDLTAFRLGRIAEWSLPRYRLDDRFVALTLLVDQGEQSTAGRWQAKEERYPDLADLLAKVPDPALVLLGSPGSGKSTLLRRFELDTAIAALQSPSPAQRERDRRGLRPRQGEGDAASLTFLIPLNQYHPTNPGDPPPPPHAWLAQRWSARYPHLPPFADLLASGRLILLLDALNEMPHATGTAYREIVGLWKRFVVETASDHPGTRIVFSCRSLDYSAPLSTPELRVPQVTIEPLSDAQVEALLNIYSPAQAPAIWARLKGSPQLAVVRSPYFLRLLVDQVEATGGVPAGPAALFTGFVREALRREVERDNPLFQPDTLLTERDWRRVARGGGWRTAWDLPARGALIPKLETLAFGMQAGAGASATSQVRVDYDAALDLIDHPRDEDILRAGLDLAVLDEDVGREEITYFHQLLQEYFAARSLANRPNPELVRQEWRQAEITPRIREVLESLAPADELPPLPTTGWEETTALAAAMADEPEAFVRGLMATNLALAGRCANQVEARGRLSESFLDELRWSLVERSRDPEADLRHRIACGLELGWLGDPRFERKAGPYGEYLMPPMAEIPGGEYPIGDDEPYVDPELGMNTAHMPRHTVPLAPFKIGQFPVTNAEWACFMAASGYDDERWWETEDARAWRKGEGTAEGYKYNARLGLMVLNNYPERLEEWLASGSIDEEMYRRWKRRLAMTEEEFEKHLGELYPGGREIAPRYWHEEHFNNPAQAVVGVCWYEVWAYCAWLSAQIGLTFRLPSEVEWEAAARGLEGRRFAYGNVFDPLKCNTQDVHVHRLSPVGVFVEGDTPMGLVDVTGNVQQWTLSLWGEAPDIPQWAYPYVAVDGREDVIARAQIQRVARGVSWSGYQASARCALRDWTMPYLRNDTLGLRLVVAAPTPLR